MRNVAAVAGLCLLLFAGWAPPAAADGGAAVSPTRLRFDAAVRTSVRGQLVLTALLTTSDGTVIPGQPIEFLRAVDLFGRREAWLGQAETDVGGVAALAHMPSLRGPQVIVVRFRGDERYAPAEASAIVDVRDVVPVFVEGPLPLAPVRQWMPVALGIVTLLVWSLFLGALTLTARAIVSADDQPDAASRARGWRTPLG